MNTKNLLNYGSIVLAGLGAIAVCVSIHTIKKTKKAIKNVNKAIDDLADKTPNDISNEIIEKAAEKIAEKAVSEGVEQARKDISVRVKSAIYSVYDDIENEVREKFEQAVERDIDMCELKKSVENKASSAIVSKFVENLSDYTNPIMSGIMSVVGKEKQ